MPNRPIPASGPCSPPPGVGRSVPLNQGQNPDPISRAATHRCCACGDLVRLLPDLQHLAEVPGTCTCGRETTFSRLDRHLPIWTVCKGPKDFPNGFTVRLHLVVGPRTFPTAKVLRAPSLDAIRDLLPRGLTRISRHPDDDPVIIESWL